MTSVENLFLRASIDKYRFPSSRGLLLTEQLWDLPLQSRDGFDLDSVAKTASASLKNLTEESFVQTKSIPGKAQAEARLEIVKYDISVKLQKEVDAVDAAAKHVKREKLLNALGDKQDAALKALTAEEILKQLEELN